MKYLFFFLSFLSCAVAKQTICLNMIVKNERPVILKCLESVKPWIDYWVIVDTGSTDGTQDLIRECLKDIPGELFERPWVDFAFNRNEALDLAREKADYSLRIDADEVLVCPPSFQMPPLIHDMYLIMIDLTKTDGFVTKTPHVFLIKNKSPGRWEGVIHETITAESPLSTCLFSDVYMKSDMVSGNRSQDPRKYHKDAKILENALSKEPNNSRNQFYLGVSYELAGELELGLEAFQKCAQMKNVQEPLQFRALLQIAVLQERLGRPLPLLVESYERAARFNPGRAEPFYCLGSLFANKVGDLRRAYEYFKKAASLPLPMNTGFVDEAVYSWAALFACFQCSEELVKLQKNESSQFLEKIQKCADCPPQLREIVESAARNK